MNKDTIITLTIVIFIFSNLNTKILYVFSLFFVFYIIYNFYVKEVYKSEKNEDKDILPKIDNIKNEKKSKNEIIPNDIEKIIKKIEKYAKYNTNDYVKGKEYLNKFFYNINNLHNSDLKNAKDYIENSIFYLKKSINHFQFIVNSIKEFNFVEQKKYDNFSSMKKSNKLSKILKNLYITCNNILNDIISKTDNVNNYYINQPEPFNNIDLKELY